MPSRSSARHQFAWFGIVRRQSGGAGENPGALGVVAAGRGPYSGGAMEFTGEENEVGA